MMGGPSDRGTAASAFGSTTPMDIKPATSRVTTNTNSTALVARPHPFTVRGHRLRNQVRPHRRPRIGTGSGRVMDRFPGFGGGRALHAAQHDSFLISPLNDWAPASGSRSSPGRRPQVSAIPASWSDSARTLACDGICVAPISTGIGQVLGADVPQGGVAGGRPGRGLVPLTGSGHRAAVQKAAAGERRADHLGGAAYSLPRPARARPSVSTGSGLAVYHRPRSRSAARLTRATHACRCIMTP